MSNRYNIERGQVYLAADGGNYGLLVLDADTYHDQDDAVVAPFTPHGLCGEPRRIDTFKLAMVRYSLVQRALAPKWVNFLQPAFDDVLGTHAIGPIEPPV